MILLRVFNLKKYFSLGIRSEECDRLGKFIKLTYFNDTGKQLFLRDRRQI